MDHVICFLLPNQSHGQYGEESKSMCLEIWKGAPLLQLLLLLQLLMN